MSSHVKMYQITKYNNRKYISSSLEDYGPSPLGFQSIQLNQSQPGNAWVLIPNNGENFTAKPLNLSVASKLRQSFSRINNTSSTPVESIVSNEPLLENAEVGKKRKKSALIAGASVASGALLFATLLIGGTFLATSGDNSKYKTLKTPYIF